MSACPNHDPNSGPGSDWCPNCGQYGGSRFISECIECPVHGLPSKAPINHEVCDGACSNTHAYWRMRHDDWYFEDGAPIPADYVDPRNMADAGDRAFGAAWRRCEAALPDDTALELRFRRSNDVRLPDGRTAQYVAAAQNLKYGRPGATATESLELLASALEQRRGRGLPPRFDG